jgi:hypothetical protein
MPNDSIFISASLLRDYLECPKKVFYRLNFPELSLQTPEMIVGNIVHSALEMFWIDNKLAIKYTRDQAEKHRLLPMHIDKALLCVSNFFDLFQNLVTDKDLVEYRFKIPFGTSYIVGKIDRIGALGYVIDWKTSSMTTRNIDKDVQFILYQYVYEQLFKKVPSSVMRVNLVDGSINTYSRDKILECSIINVVIPVVIAAIQQETLSPLGLFIGKCARCPAKIACHKDLGY